MTKLTTICAVLAFHLAAPAAMAATAQEIMSLYDKQSRADAEQVKLTMRLVNPQGKVRQRTINYQTKTNEQGKQNSLLRFVEPADVRGTALLTLEHAQDDDDRWLYLPAMRKVRRIAATEDNENFMGSDFAYEDIDFEELANNSYTLLKSEMVAGTDTWVIQATPTPQSRDKSGYSKRVLWIRKDNYAVVQVDYYDKKDELFKKRQATGLAEVDQSGKWRPKRQEMLNTKTGHKTEIVYEDYRIGGQISDDVFSQRTLADNR
ncbi:outer membrane lipoprotein-sorting protein [Chitinolyticbacter albus]|uniref:outer membrane lipoprotein-sorting protein n=1 Tax=Chitinolyticbacter albus TaxID=2961951 RepID=UPI00210D2C11|nr:outer membrane lipoprotein-sorting protein [Chitinolyticbacter albus]